MYRSHSVFLGGLVLSRNVNVSLNLTENSTNYLPVPPALFRMLSLGQRFTLGDVLCQD